MEYHIDTQVCVIGAGHAGVEAALACSRLGLKTVIFTMNVDSIENGMSEDFFSIDLMNAYRVLGTILGEAVEDDLVEEIFSKFCMGK